MWLWSREHPQIEERRAQLQQAIVGYPIYDPPHRQGPNYPEECHGKGWPEFCERNLDNFEYFRNSVPHRLAALEGLLGNFGVSFGYDDPTLARVSEWCDNYSGLLGPGLHKESTADILFALKEPWTGRWLGLNIVFDLGVFLGECILTRRPRLRWIGYRGVSRQGKTNLSGFNLVGFNQKSYTYDPIDRAFGCCINREAVLKNRNEWNSFPSNLCGKVKDISTR